MFFLMVLFFSKNSKLKMDEDAKINGNLFWYIIAVTIPAGILSIVLDKVSDLIGGISEHAEIICIAVDYGSRDMLLKSSLRSVCHKLAHLFAAAYRGNTRIIKLNYYIFAMLANIEFHDPPPVELYGFLRYP